MTATGPVYLGWRTGTVVPIASMFALLQELALRVDRGDAAVQSSLARRVSGDDAYNAWMELSVECAMQLERVTIGGRRQFLRIVLALVHRSGHIEGLETIVASAVNAVWPWLSREDTNSVLALTSGWLQKSRFAQRHPIPVVDLVQRSAGFFSPGAIAKLDLVEWRAWRDLQAGGSNAGDAGLGAKLQMGLKSPLERAIDDMFGGSSQESSEIIGAAMGGDTSGVPGGLPSAGDLPGAHAGTSRRGGQSLDDIAAGLIGGTRGDAPGGLPSLAGLPGAKATGRRNGEGQGQASSLLDGIPGSDYQGVSGFLRQHGASGFKTGLFEGATPGGPFAPPGQLGIDGTGGDSDGGDKLATGVIALGGVIVALALAPAEIPVIAGVGAVAVAAGAGYFIGEGARTIIYGKEQPAPPPKERPHAGDLYPDPIGGGGGNPTQLPAFDGDGGGPTRLPDSDGHGGGTPNTVWGKTSDGASIWDENFGGHGPTVRPSTFAVPTLAGPGLMADLVQVGRSTVRF